MIPITDGIKNIPTNIAEVTRARDDILNIINKDIKIKYPTSRENFTLQTDSSNKACSGILTQSHGIIGIFRKFTETEFKYNTM